VSESSFITTITYDDAIKFAEISGDWNPLHTDKKYARNTKYKTPILHGAFSAGLVSRLAGMYLPGKDCLLHSVNLKFVAPLIPPATLLIKGKLTSSSKNNGRVDVSITDKNNGTQYVNGYYHFGYHQTNNANISTSSKQSASSPVTLVTGASGGIGAAILRLLGKKGIGTSRQNVSGLANIPNIENINNTLPECRLNHIVHCASPLPDKIPFTDLELPSQSIETHVSEPLRQVQALAQLLKTRGCAGSTLILIGSTWSEPGRHNFKSPLYSLAKSLIPTLNHILSLELGKLNMRCISIIYDVIEGGMNEDIGELAKLSHIDRNPFGILASPKDAAEQILWVLDNPNNLASGAVIKLSAGASP